MHAERQLSKRKYGLPISPEISIFDLFAELKEMQERASKKPDQAQNKPSGIISFGDDLDEEEIIFDDDLSHEIGDE